MGNLPGLLTLFSKQSFLLAALHLASSDKIADDAKPEYGHIFLLLLFHGKTSSVWFKFSREIAWMEPARQKHSSVEPAGTEREPGLNRPAHGPDAVPAEIVEGLQQIVGPAVAQAGLDLLFEAAQPMTLTGGGTAGRPSEESEAMKQAFPDIGNRGLKSAPVTCRADSEDPPAMATTIPGQRDRQRKSIKPGGSETVAPQSPSALGTAFYPGPIIATSQLKEALDGNV